MVISRCCFADDGTDLFISVCRTCSTLVFLHSTNQILNLWRSCCGCHPRCQSSLIREFKQPRRRQRQEHHTFAYFTIKTIHLLNPPKKIWGGAETPKSLIASAAYAIESAMVKNCLFWGWSSINMRKTIEILALWELIKELENHFINTRKKTQQNKYATRFGKEGEIVFFNLMV